MKRAALAFGLAFAAAGLSGCGFQPLYAPGAFNGKAAIGPVRVEMIPGKSGHALKSELDRLFAAEREGAGAARTLEIQLEELVVGLGYTVNDAATRSDLRLTASYVLVDSAGKQAVAGRQGANISYDIPIGAFGEIAAQDNARERAALVLAERIRTDIVLRLARGADSKSKKS